MTDQSPWMDVWGTPLRREIHKMLPLGVAFSDLSIEERMDLIDKANERLNDD